jgi:hypothetical protein
MVRERTKQEEKSRENSVPGQINAFIGLKQIVDEMLSWLLIPDTTQGGERR